MAGRFGDFSIELARTAPVYVSISDSTNEARTYRTFHCPLSLHLRFPAGYLLFRYSEGDGHELSSATRTEHQEAQADVGEKADL